MRRRDVVVGAAALGACASIGEPERRHLVIAHRGASGERPEHTMSAYRLAIEQGANFIEPDLVITKDGVLVCRHECEISATTNVAALPQFASRRTIKVVDGQATEGWFAEDFTLAELKTLRCRERLPQVRPANVAYDGQDEIPTFAEVAALAMSSNVGVYPELKHPTFLRAQGHDVVLALIQAVQAGGGQALANRAFVQCFEVGPLIVLAQMSSLRWRCVQLIAADTGPYDRQDLTPAEMTSDQGLANIAQYAQGIGVEKSLIVPRDSEGRSLPATNLITRAHAARLVVHAWTFRAENMFLPTDLRRGDTADAAYLIAHGDLDAELKAFYALNVDGVFSDFPALAVAART